MKNILLIILLIGLTAYAQIEDPRTPIKLHGALVMEFPENTQTEQEILDFLNSALAAYGADRSFESFKTKIHISTTIDPVSNKKVLQFDFYTTSGILYTSRVHPEHVNAVIEKRAPNGNLGLRMISQDGLISKKYTADKDPTFWFEVSFVLSTSDEEVRKIRKGLLHLLKLNNAPLLGQKFLKEKNE